MCSSLILFLLLHVYMYINTRQPKSPDATRLQHLAETNPCLRSALLSTRFLLNCFYFKNQSCSVIDESFLVEEKDQSHTNNVELIVFTLFSHFQRTMMHKGLLVGVREGFIGHQLVQGGTCDSDSLKMQRGAGVRPNNSSTADGTLNEFVTL